MIFTAALFHQMEILLSIILHMYLVSLETLGYGREFKIKFKILLWQKWASCL